MPLRLALALGVATALVVSAASGAARDKSNLVFVVAAKGAPQPAEVSCASAPFSGQSGICLALGASYRWTGTVHDGAAGITGRLTGRCTASGRADGALGGGEPVPRRALVAEASFTLTEFGQANANCSFVLAFRHGSLSGTAAVSSTLQEGGKAGASSESVTLSVTGGTGVYAGRTGRGGGRLVTTVPATTVYCEAVYACRLPIPLVIPRVDAQSEPWHLTLH